MEEVLNNRLGVLLYVVERDERDKWNEGRGWGGGILRLVALKIRVLAEGVFELLLLHTSFFSLIIASELG